MNRARFAWTLCISLAAATSITWAGPAGPHKKLSPFLSTIWQESERQPDAAAQMANLHGLKVTAGPQGSVVAVIVEPNPGKTPGNMNRNLITATGAQIDATSTSWMRILVPIHRLHLLETHPDILTIREPTPCIASDLGMGDNVSESINLTGADDFQLAGITGTGIKVAVVDLGFYGLNATISAGDLPANTVIVDLPGTQDNPIEAVTSHGVGVAEHVMDMAPGATLYCIKVSDEVDLQNAANYIRDNGIRVANHSVGWVNSSYYDDSGPINTIFNNSRDIDGIFWTVSAGNNAIRHWRGGWSDPNPNNRLNFTPTDENMDLTSASSTVNIFLNWNQYGNSVTDLDLYVVNKNGVIIAQGVLPQTGPQVPREAVGFAYNASQAPYRIQVRRYSGPTEGLDITIFSFYNNLEYAVPANSLMDPADAHGAFAVGAINQANWHLNPPPLESFSSQGPTVDGRAKPDITSPDGTTSRTYGAFGSFGTSFSSPTTAGAAALLLAEEPSRTAGDIDILLRTMAVDVGSAGPDNAYGAGKLFIGMQPQDTTSPTLINAVSRKLHAAAGEFDLTLPISGTSGIECRNGGPTKLVFTCDEPIMAADGQLDANEIVLSQGIVQSITITGQELIVAISGVSNQTCLNVTLAGIADLAGNPLAGDVDVSIRVVLGDANSDGSVSITDQLLIKNRIAQQVTTENVRCDPNLSGTISITDQLLVKNHIGGTASCP